MKRRFLDLQKYQRAFRVDGSDDGGAAGGGAPSVEQTLSDVFAGKANSDVVIPEPGATGNSDGDGAGAGGAGSSTPDAGAGGGASAGQPSNNDWFFNEMKTRISTAEKPWEIPQELVTGKKADGTEMTAAERFEATLKHIYDNTEFDNDDDDFIASYRAEKTAAGDKFDLHSYIQKQNDNLNILKADDNTFYTKYLESFKKEDGTSQYSADQIKDHISKLDPISLAEKVTALKSAIAEQNKQLTQKSNESIKQAEQAEYEKWETARKAEVSKVLADVKNTVKDIGGIPITEGDLKEFEPVFDRMTQRNPETGNLYMDDYLRSNNNQVFKMLYLMHLVDGGNMANYFSNYKEEVKQKLLDKTSISPNITHGLGVQGGVSMPKSTDFH